MATTIKIETSNSIDLCTRRSSRLVAYILLKVVVVSLARGKEPYLLLTQDVVKTVRLLQQENPK
jgi:hypothetical protein